MLEFTELVRRAKEEKSSLTYVDACKAYIEKNLRKNLQVGDIAPAIGLSRTYLSRLFHQAEGITVQQYIQKEKCRHAAQMLQYTDYSISQIAQYFGFSSQSYFGTCFQTWYGMTPNAYRKKKQG
jgi:AraC-like DNA-binding protein